MKRLRPGWFFVADKSRLPCSWVCCSESHARRKKTTRKRQTTLSVKTKVTEVSPGGSSASVWEVGRPEASAGISYQYIWLFPPDAPWPVSAAAPNSSNLLRGRSVSRARSKRRLIRATFQQSYAKHIHFKQKTEHIHTFMHTYTRVCMYAWIGRLLRYCRTVFSRSEQLCWALLQLRSDILRLLRRWRRRAPLCRSRATSAALAALPGRRRAGPPVGTFTEPPSPDPFSLPCKMHGEHPQPMEEQLGPASP